MIVYLALTFCLASDCRTERLPLYGATLLQCQNWAPAAQVVAARWIREGERFQGWRCGVSP